MRLFLTLVAGPGSYEDLQELYEPIKEHFDGICCVYHGERDDLEAKYLELSKGTGRVVYLPYVGRHDLSRVVAVHCGAIEQGDLVMQCDVLERPILGFVTATRGLMVDLLKRGINAITYYGKIYVYAYHESVTFQGTPHEGFRRLDGQLGSAELSEFYPDESQIRLNVRPRKRPVDHFVKHYARYALLPWGSNHYILPLSGKPNASELFAQREAARMAFIDLLRELGVKRDVDAVIEYMRGKMDPRFVAHVERDKVWNDVYRRYVLGRLDFVDDHDWSNVVKVEPIPLDAPGQAV